MQTIDLNTKLFLFAIQIFNLMSSFRMNDIKLIGNSNLSVNHFYLNSYSKFCRRFYSFISIGFRSYSSILLIYLFFSSFFLAKNDENFHKKILSRDFHKFLVSH